MPALGSRPVSAVLPELDAGRGGEVKTDATLVLAGGATTVDPHGHRVRVLGR